MLNDDKRAIIRTRKATSAKSQVPVLFDDMHRVYLSA